MNSNGADEPIPDSAMIQRLRDLGLLGESDPHCEALTGGVSSEIWKLSDGVHEYCVKRALSKLNVDTDWFAPIERNAFEVNWCRIANKVLPGSAPKILAHDKTEMFCVMEYLHPSTHVLWKDELRCGRADPEYAAQCAQRLAGIHSATANQPEIAQLFPRTDIFHAIRLLPYLEATAQKHPDLHSQLFFLSRRTAKTRLAMIHGDVSPKNILIGPNGPVFLDAECACMGDPAFDLAFCLNHFLLKCLWVREARAALDRCFETMSAQYLSGVDWEHKDDLEVRAASLLPGLFLARIDGKSAVEYVTDENEKNKVRRCARQLLLEPPNKLVEVMQAWRAELDK